MTALQADSIADVSHVKTRVDAILEAFLERQDQSACGSEISVFTKFLRKMLAAGGKRIRPRLCIVGWSCVSDEVPPPLVYRIAASLELFHAFALIHDDIMDKSATRRGLPTAHHALAAHLRHFPSADQLGNNAAILLGDLALGWSYDLIQPEPHEERQLPVPYRVLSMMRTETAVGQYLDLLASAPASPCLATAWKVVQYKTAKYTFERPIQIGALLAGATDDQVRALSAFAVPLGEAFQLRDDLLGIFGDPKLTGKSVLDDLREGKHTVLMCAAFERATASQVRRLRRHLGNARLTSDGAQECRDILLATGADKVVEDLISSRFRASLEFLDAADIRPTAKAALHQLASNTVARSY
ncbi:polyprenyl synthetase family protein [Paenarthrobacter sp. NPDC089989]|uniref:polyprenyl synthetase family protein n=1 Tax=unclassified Paenarthrobacter TaxID=2634190 RepID=UPI0038014544